MRHSLRLRFVEKTKIQFLFLKLTFRFGVLPAKGAKAYIASKGPNAPVFLEPKKKLATTVSLFMQYRLATLFAGQNSIQLQLATDVINGSWLL